VTWILGGLVVALIGSWAWARFRPDPLERPRGRVEQRVIRVQVLNGSGEAGLGLRAASHLREGGFQVVDVRNADRSDYFETLVVARRQDPSLATAVAQYLGSPPVIRQVWDSDQADVTLVLGSDRSRVHLEP
jgi:hypothetical protein